MTTTPADLLEAVRSARTRAEAAEVEVLLLAIEWAHAHPVLDEQGREADWAAPRAGAFDDGAPDPGVDPGLEPEDAAWFGIPPVAWAAPAAFGAACSMSTVAGRALIRDGLVLLHRLPGVYARVVAGEVAVWRARRVARAVLGLPRDVVEHVDAALAARAGVWSAGPVVVDRVLDEAMLALYPEEREAAQLEALDRRHARLDERSLNDSGIGEMSLRGDWVDLVDFDRALAAVAAALVPQLAAEGISESLDVRRARAVGVLADPAAALDLLHPADLDEPGEPHEPGEPARRRGGVTRRVDLVVHLTDLALRGLDPVARDGAGRVWLESVVREWCGREGTRVVVRPVLDLADGVPEPATQAYAPTAAQRELVGLRDRTCVFPWCTRPASACDVDHLIPYDEGGPTRSDNLAALCRHHHRLKTHAGWSYEMVGPGEYLWHDPHGQVFHRAHDGRTVHVPHADPLHAYPPDARVGELRDGARRARSPERPRRMEGSAPRGDPARCRTLHSGTTDVGRHAERLSC